MKIINLTQHEISDEQKANGVVALLYDDQVQLRKLLTFDELPSARELYHRADVIANLAEQYKPDWAMIGGAPFFSTALEKALRVNGITPVYAFSVRESKEETIDGKLVKTSVFKHRGFVNPRT